MSRSINDINNTLISLCAILDSWCDLDHGLQRHHEGQRHALHNFLIDSYITLQWLKTHAAVPADRKIIYASMLHDMTMEDLRKELRELLYEYLCALDALERQTDGSSIAAIGKIDLILTNNRSKVKEFEVPI
jgi:hypothetical protein